MCTPADLIHSFAALTDRGLSRRTVARHVAGGSLVRVRRGVYADRSVCDVRRTAAAHGGGLACISAARHLGLWVLAGEQTVHVWLGGHGRAFVHESCRCVAHADGTSSGFGIPSIPRILRQILRCRGREEFFVTFESARRQNLITPSGVDWLRAHTNDAARAAIALARDDADSGLESLVRWRLRHRGLRIRTQVSLVAVGRVDLVIGDRLIVEVDGVENHDSPALRHKDLVRDAHAAAWGFLTLRFDYALVVHDWATVELAILSYVDRGLHLSAPAAR